jgi:hypothetical protein
MTERCQPRQLRSVYLEYENTRPDSSRARPFHHCRVVVTDAGQHQEGEPLHNTSTGYVYDRDDGKVIGVDWKTTTLGHKDPQRYDGLLENRRSEFYGFTELSEEEVHKLAHGLIQYQLSRGETYNVLYNNCEDFAQTLAGLINKGSVDSERADSTVFDHMPDPDTTFGPEIDGYISAQIQAQAQRQRNGEEIRLDLPLLVRQRLRSRVGYRSASQAYEEGLQILQHGSPSETHEDGGPLVENNESESNANQSGATARLYVDIDGFPEAWPFEPHSESPHDAGPPAEYDEPQSSSSSLSTTPDPREVLSGMSDPWRCESPFA